MKANKILWIKSKLIEKIQAQTFLWYPKETGGLLAGYNDKKGNIVISNITKSGPKAIHGNYSYTPDYKYDEKKIAQIYHRSKGVNVYLGDWHTHPKSSSYMSSQDVETLFQIARYREARMPTPIMIILGTMPFQIRAWQLKKSAIHEIEISVY